VVSLALVGTGLVPRVVAAGRRGLTVSPEDGVCARCVAATDRQRRDRALGSAVCFLLITWPLRRVAAELLELALEVEDRSSVTDVTTGTRSSQQ